MRFSRNFMIFPIIIVIAFSSYGYAFDSGGPEFAPDRFVISVEKGNSLIPFDMKTGFQSTGYDDIDNLVLNLNVGGIDRYYPGRLKKPVLREVVDRMYIVRIENQDQLQEAIFAFDTNSRIEFAEPFYINYLDYIPNDPLIGSWYHLNNIEAYLAWDVIRGDSTDRAILGVVDSGVYYDHPDLEPNMWINPGEDINNDGQFTQDDINGIDDDGNDFIDDVVGYDLAMSDPYPMEPIPWHGTHVAGCATMATDNEYGGAAVGWAARIMAVKAAQDNNPNSIPYGYSGIIYAADNGCNVINLSWGRSGGFSQGEQNVINAAYNAGAVVVAAAGNENSSSPHWPAAYEHTVAVAATGASDRKASFSNYGTWVDISAPGENIISTWDHSSFTALDGTSMASPVTAGVVCLIRAANPGWTVDQVVNHLKSTADDIDSLNPGYENMLGAGRVNAAAAVGRDLVPRIVVSDVAINLTSDDGDGILNPSESFDMVVTLTDLWADADNVTGVLRAEDGFTVSDSVADFGNISGSGGSSDNAGSPFAVDVDDDIIVGVHHFTLQITADNYAVQQLVSVTVSLEQAGFPANIPDLIESSPLVFDIDQDGSKEIVISANDRKYYSFESNGGLTPGWPQPVNDIAQVGAAIGDLDNDGDFEVVGASRVGSIYAWNHDGSLLDGFPVSGGSIIYATPTLGDIDGDNDLEIICASFANKTVTVFDHNGEVYSGWPFVGNGAFYGSGALADLDGDDLPEIIFCDFESTVHAWNADNSYVSGFPIELSGPIQAAPAVADIDGNGSLDIVAATFSGDVYAISNAGEILSGWPVSLGVNIKSSPSIGDIDSDGHLEIVLGDNSGNLYAFNSNGQPQSGYPIAVGGSISGSPVIGDINGDGVVDVVIGSSNGNIYAFDGNGESLRNFPIPTLSGGSIPNSVGLTDLDGDGDVEIVAGVRFSGQNLEVIDYKASITEENFPWPFYCNDVFRSAYYGDFTTGVSEDSENEIPLKFELLENYPNPFNANTIIRFSVPEPGDVNLRVFDIMGREVKSLVNGSLDAGIHEIIWDGTDDAGNIVSSGIYFYNLRNETEDISKRMIMLK